MHQFSASTPSPSSRTVSAKAVCGSKGVRGPCAAARPAAQSTISSDREALNGLFHRLEGLRERKRSFTAFAAYELKTPLAGLKTQAQIATLTPDAATRDRALAQIARGVDRTDRMVRQLLDMTAAEQHAGPGAGQRPRPGRDGRGAVRAGAVARDRAASAPRRRLAALLAPALRNLLENAILAAPAGTGVEARLDHDGNRVRFSVLDRGPGIDEADRPHVTERFHRGAASPSGGGALDLSIVAAAVRAMGGELRLAPAPAPANRRKSSCPPRRDRTVTGRIGPA